MSACTSASTSGPALPVTIPGAVGEPVRREHLGAAFPVNPGDAGEPGAHSHLGDVVRK